MAEVSYGGAPGGRHGVHPRDSIILQGATILDDHRQHEHRGPDYLWTVRTVRVRCLYNPLATSATRNATAPVQRIGFKAPVTDEALRHYLSQPRRQLVIKIGGTTVLQCPRAGFVVDAQNGPVVEVNDISLISGTKTFVVDLTFTCRINECSLFNATPSVMLSHRWRMEHDIDQDHFTTRVTHGYAVLNTERLIALGGRADDFRSYLFHPMPATMQRVNVQVVVPEGGNELHYTIVDRERAQSLIAAGVTRIESTHVSSTEKGDFWESASGSILKATAAVQGHHARKARGRIDSLWDLGARLVGVAGEALKNNVPNNVQSVDCHVWGNRFATREFLMLTAMRVCEWRLQHLLNAGNGTHSVLMEDLAGKYAHARMSVTSGFVNQVMAGGFRPDWPAFPGEGPKGNLPRGLKREEIPNVLDPTGARPNPNLPSDGGARGTYLESLVTAALLAPCAVPAAGPVAGRFASRTPP